jgi:hypothetical protein
MYLIFYYFFLRLSVRARHAPAGVPPHAMFRWRARRHTVSGDEISESISKRLRMFFLPRRRVAPKNVRGHRGGRLKPLATFLSLLHVKVQESPPYFHLLHFSAVTFNFVSGSHFWYISFDLVRLGPPIGFNSVSIFQFGPPSFNFRIGLKKMNLFGTVVSISSILSFD